MKKLPYIFGLVLLMLAGCGGVKTAVDYDESINFNRYTDFSFYDNMKTGLTDLDENRFKDAVVKALEEKGISEADNPQLRVNFYSKSFDKRKQHNIGVNIGTIGRHVRGNVGSGIPIRSTQHILSVTVELVDAQSDILIWQGVAEGDTKGNTSPEKRREFFEKMAKKLLKNYPPK